MRLRKLCVYLSDGREDFSITELKTFSKHDCFSH